MGIDLSVIIVSYNTKQLLVDCIKSVIKNTKGINYEIIVIDNASIDGSIKALKGLKVKVIENEENVGFARANNQGIRLSKGKYILLLNSDTIVRDNVLFHMVRWMDNNTRVGISSCALLNPDESIQGSGGYFPTLPRVFSWMTIQDIPFVDNLIKPYHPVHRKSFNTGTDFYITSKELDWVTGAFFLIRRDAIDDIGLIDEDYFMYVEDLDYCYMARKKGWKVYYVADFGIIHIGGASGTSEFAIVSEYKNLQLFYKKHYPSWQLPILRLLLKIGALARITLFGILDGPRSAKIYAKAFWIS